MGNNIDWVTKRLNGEGPPIIIDGGMGTELEKTNVPMDGKIWSGRAVLSHPKIVREVHQSFVEAGAEVIIANTFATGRHMLEPGGLDDHVRDININAVKIARAAADNVADRPVAVAGSICEWAHIEIEKWNATDAIKVSAREQAGLLKEAGADLITLEMCQRRDYSPAVVEAALETGLPIWIGVSARRHKGCSHLSTFDMEDDEFEPLIEVLAAYSVDIMNVMHTPVTDVNEALGIIRKYWDGPLGVYPESGYFTMPNWNFVDIIEPEELVSQAKGWVDDGVTLLGGCCGLGPDHIRALRDAF